jgi:hypothetical protein
MTYIIRNKGNVSQDALQFIAQYLNEEKCGPLFTFASIVQAMRSSHRATALLLSSILHSLQPIESEFGRLRNLWPVGRHPLGFVADTDLPRSLYK